MKKVKSFSCVLILSACLVGNVSAGDIAGGGVLSYFDSVIDTIVSYVSGAADCEIRICTNCKPGGTDGNGNGNCKPNE